MQTDRQWGSEMRTCYLPVYIPLFCFKACGGVVQARAVKTESGQEEIKLKIKALSVLNYHAMKRSGGMEVQLHFHLKKPTHFAL
jgi:predicted component of type VI protein secretion system